MDWRWFCTRTLGRKDLASHKGVWWRNDEPYLCSSLSLLSTGMFSWVTFLHLCVEHEDHEADFYCLKMRNMIKVVVFFLSPLQYFCIAVEFCTIILTNINVIEMPRVNTAHLTFFLFHHSSFLYLRSSFAVSLSACRSLQSRPSWGGDPRYLSVSAHGSLIAEGTAGRSGSRHWERLEWLEHAAVCQTAPAIQTLSGSQS